MNELSLFQLVARHGSFTTAAEAAGLTQSAITRQVQEMERSLGLDLLERTTRNVRLTPAGEFLFRASAPLLGSAEQTLRDLKEQFAGARKEVRIGVSRSIGLAYLPGLFHANLRKLPHVSCRVSSQASAEIVSAVENNELDLGVLCVPKRLPRTISVTHRFEDSLTLIAPSRKAPTAAPAQDTLTKWEQIREWAQDQSWLLIEERSNTGKQLAIG